MREHLGDEQAELRFGAAAVSADPLQAQDVVLVEGVFDDNLPPVVLVPRTAGARQTAVFTRRGRDAAPAR
jgi:hypothetical protein